MRNGIQDIFKMLGKGGCFALVLIKYCQTHFGYKGDVLDAICRGIDKGYIHYNPANPLDEMCGYVYNSIAFIKMLTGYDVRQIQEEVTGYVRVPTPDCVNFWQLPNAQMGVGHFTFGEWSSLEDSNNVRNGYLKQIRRYEIVGE